MILKTSEIKISIKEGGVGLVALSSQPPPSSFMEMGTGSHTGPCAWCNALLSLYRKA